MTLRRILLGTALAGSLGWPCRDAEARSTIRQPDDHPHYVLELEPHLAIGLFDPPGLGTGNGFGPGVRLSFPLSEDGFLPRLNDTIALGTGLDWVFYDAEQRGRGVCTRFVTAPNGTQVCVEIGGESGDSTYFYVPLVMQWNFWFHDRVSGFVEPGLGLYRRDDSALDDADYGANLVLQLGVRFLFADSIALVGRLGYPTASVGVSFLF